MSSNELSLRYDLLNSQMNPHFINNAIQSICNSITKGNVNQSINWLNRLSHLYRLVQKSTKCKMIDLQEELEISTLYIELQRDLFDKGFSYVIKIDESLKEDLEHTKVPPLILQPLIENAILHGLKRMKQNGKGELQITVTVEKEMLYICITDNGNGITKTEKELNESSGISLENINERLKIINGGKSEKKLLEVRTLKNDTGIALGTQSCLRIPLIQI
ncbi:histidine kinase [Kordia algicida OT-1]|uniref:Two-component sensor kinase yesM n=1 Tax=Kordia algicida OT-1 TaxID=391587 RepID=A9DMW1_9FLAO|nr:histidine kinase [Kordia algicida]EDP97801.1 two-component sensor kinase yesM [Kordia algicida OT-1]